MLGYKVVNGKRSFKPATDSALQCVRYRVGEMTTREEIDAGAFAVFANLAAAQAFAQKYGNAILEVEYTASKECALWKRNPPRFVRNRFGKGYHAESNGISAKTDDFPPGTAFADEVYVIRVVERV
jgi:hypothetical protein